VYKHEQVRRLAVGEQNQRPALMENVQSGQRWRNLSLGLEVLPMLGALELPDGFEQDWTYMFILFFLSYG
jgi:hypothetical protein